MALARVEFAVAGARRGTASQDREPMLNWRLRSGRRLTGQSQSDECLYQRLTANSDRWASRACGIGLHDSSAAGAGTDLRSRSSARNLRLSRRAKRPASSRGVDEQLFRGHTDVVDADLADYFGSIPHADLLKSVARRIVDRRVPHLIKTWLECPVEETDQRGRTTRTTEARDSRQALRRVHPLSSSPPPDACR